MAAVSLDPASEQAAFSVWESQHNTAALQEVDLVTPEYETDMMVRQIENITEVGSHHRLTRNEILHTYFYKVNFTS